MGKSQLILGFQVIKEASKIVYPYFDLLRLDKEDLNRVFPLAKTVVAGSNQPKGDEG